MMNSLDQGKKIIKDKIPLIPKNPGVYKMLSSSGEKFYQKLEIDNLIQSLVDSLKNQFEN